MKALEDKDKSDGEEELDEYGNPIEKDEEANDNERIKSNLKNSSKVYYAITHSI